MLDGGGPKDSENTLNSFLTKCGENVFRQIGTDMCVACWDDRIATVGRGNFRRSGKIISEMLIILGANWYQSIFELSRTTYYCGNSEVATCSLLIQPGSQLCNLLFVSAVRTKNILVKQAAGFWWW